MDVHTENRGRPRQKVCFPVAPEMGKNFRPLGIWAQGSGMSTGRIRTNNFMLMLFVLPWSEFFNNWGVAKGSSVSWVVNLVATIRLIRVNNVNVVGAISESLAHEFTCE